MDIANTLYDTINYVVSNKISKINRDITLKCYIKKKISTTKYEVQYQDATFTAYSMYPFDGFLGQSVWVVIPEGDMTAERKIIIYYE